MPKPFPTNYKDARSREKTDRKPFEPAGPPKSVDRKPASPVPAAQVKEFATVTASKSSTITSIESVEAKVGTKPSLKAPNTAVPDH